MTDPLPHIWHLRDEYCLACGVTLQAVMLGDSPHDCTDKAHAERNARLAPEQPKAAP